MAEYQDYFRHEQEQATRRAAEIRIRHEAARAAAGALAQLLATRFAVDRVYLFGSVTTGHFSLASDLDLACAGLAPEQFFTAWSELNDATEFRVDLVRLEDAPQTLRDRILAEGVILYERGGGEGGGAASSGPGAQG